MGSGGLIVAGRRGHRPGRADLTARQTAHRERDASSYRLRQSAARSWERKSKELASAERTIAAEKARGAHLVSQARPGREKTAGGSATPILGKLDELASGQQANLAERIRQRQKIQA